MEPQMTFFGPVQWDASPRLGLGLPRNGPPEAGGRKWAGDKVGVGR